jgi:hypothetical protein
LPPWDEELPAAEPKHMLRAFGDEIYFIGKVVAGVIGGLWVGFQVLGIGLVTQQIYATDLAKIQVQFADHSARLSLCEFRLDHQPNDTPSRTASMYPTGAHR